MWFLVFRLLGGVGKAFLSVYVLGVAGIPDGEGVASTIILRWMQSEGVFFA